MVSNPDNRDLKIKRYWFYLCQWRSNEGNRQALCIVRTKFEAYY